MNINSIFNQINNAITNNTSNQSLDKVSEGLKNGLDMIINGGSNQVIAGKIISIDGENILLSMGENELLNARLEGNTNANIGDILTFSVKSSDSSKISLTPLFENSNQVSTVNSALNQAQLPVTAQNQYMVKSMMQEGLPIDKQSLYDMSKAMQLNATEDVLTLAKMSRLNIPLTDEMITQFKNYTNFEHLITNSLSDIADSFMESYEMILADGNENEAVLFIKDNIDALLSDLNEQVLNNDNVNNENTVTNTLNNVNSNNEVNALSDNTNKSENIINVNDNENTILSDNKVINNSSNSVLEDLKFISLSDNQKEAVINNKNGFDDVLKDVFKQIKDLDISKLSKEDISNLSQDIKKLFNDSVFKNSFKKAVLDKYLLDPEDLAKEGEVSRLYEKLSSNLKQLNNTTENNTQTPFAQNINNLNSNLDFMNELNQTFNYVQIPLKMNDKEAAGELYVYSNKKSLAQSDGNVSALLHLDMEHLGPMDVHVFLNANINDVKTKFYLQDDAALDLIAENIDVLNKRLEKRGYKMSSEFINDDIKNSVMDKILEDNKNISMISSSSFDARA